MMIDDLPRPWLLAAMTGVPMSELLRARPPEGAGALERHDEQQHETRRTAAERTGNRPHARRRELVRLAS